MTSFKGGVPLWILGAGAAAGCRCQTRGRARFGAWALLLLPGAWPRALFAWALFGMLALLAGAAECRCRVLLLDAYGSVRLRAARSCRCPQISFTICGPMPV